MSPGWQPLLWPLHARLLRIHPSYSFLLAKQKFGKLAIYSAHAPADVAGRVTELVQEAEHTSLRTCEFCGHPGYPRRQDNRPTGGIRTVCDAHTTREAQLALTGR